MFLTGVQTSSISTSAAADEDAPIPLPPLSNVAALADACRQHAPQAAVPHGGCESLLPHVPSSASPPSLPTLAQNHSDLRLPTVVPEVDNNLISTAPTSIDDRTSQNPEDYVNTFSDIANFPEFNLGSLRNFLPVESDTPLPPLPVPQDDLMEVDWNGIDWASIDWEALATLQAVPVAASATDSRDISQPVPLAGAGTDQALTMSLSSLELPPVNGDGQHWISVGIFG
ncbi:hypothetical protein PHLCEN_2v7263 [Hermanssonia centrifuga]|uniref:Uncharacterized protein n=1 Tax=Hermanssonia centrifuga TaxID=98765 RepID=A0A2R6NX16_9APHY|nr:hypothetical protein PHLCEN_2v7263 [Hermanssonia centrifuga]